MHRQTDQCIYFSSLGSVINTPLNNTTHSNVNVEDASNFDDGQDIGVVGKGKLTTWWLKEKNDIHLSVLSCANSTADANRYGCNKNSECQCNDGPIK